MFVPDDFVRSIGWLQHSLPGIGIVEHMCDRFLGMERLLDVVALVASSQERCTILQPHYL